MVEYISAFLGAFGGVFFAEWLKSYLARKHGNVIYTIKIKRINEI